MSNITSEKIYKLKRSIKDTGFFLIVVGWLNVLILVGFYIWSTINKEVGEVYRWTVWDVAYSLFLIVLFIFMGSRIEAMTYKNTRTYLRIILALSILNAVYNLITNPKNAAGFLSGLLFITLPVCYALSSIKKLISNGIEPFLSDTTPNKTSIDDESYAIAMKELQSGKINEGLMARCFVECKGDEKAANASYVRLRAMGLIDEKQRIEVAKIRSEKHELEKIKEAAEVRSEGNILGEIILGTIGAIFLIGVISLVSTSFTASLILAVISFIFFFAAWSSRTGRIKKAMREIKKTA